MNTLLLATITLDPNKPAHVALVCFLALILMALGASAVNDDKVPPICAFLGLLMIFVLGVIFLLTAAATIIQSL